MLLAFGVYLLYRFSEVLTPLVIAVILAYILSPLARWFSEHLHISRGWGTILAYLVMVVILITIPFILIPPLAAQSVELNLDFQRFMVEAEEQIDALLGNRYQIAGWTIDVSSAIDRSIVAVQGLIEPVVGQTLGFAVELITSLVWIVFLFVVSFYLTKDAPSLIRWLDHITPPGYKEDFIHMRREINLIWGSFFRGQLVLAIVVATIFTVVGFIIGMPFALAMGVLAGMLELLPSIGHAIWLVTASTLALFFGSTWMPVPNWVFALIVIGLQLFFQQFDINYLMPRIIGRRVNLPPLVVILGIVSGAVLAGVLGVLLAAPTIASARVIGRYIYANLFDMDPFPDSVAQPLPPPNPRWWRKTADEEQIASTPES